MSSPTIELEYHRLNDLLWRYRPCLDRFEFLLEVQLMVASTGRTEWLHHVADLLDEVAQTINTLDLEREVVIGSGRTLRELAEAAPEPWSDILLDQHGHLAAAVARTSRLRDRNRRVIEVNGDGLERLLANIAEATGQGSATTDSYDGDGRVRHDSPSTILFDGRA